MAAGKRSMPHEPRKLLWDARDALDAVSGFITGKTREEFVADRLPRSGVERQFEIAGEALAKLAKLNPQTALRITDLRRAVAFRNVLIHGYADVDPELVWRVATEHMPGLRENLDELLTDSRS